MNIYMTGSSGTGKTSLAQELCNRLGMREAPSVSRTSPYPMRTQICQDYIMHGVDYQCRTATESVVTRTPIDVAAYSHVWGLDMHEVMPVVARFFMTSPVLLYLPKYWDPADDGFRPTDGQDEVDAVIAELISLNPNSGVNYLYVVQDESIADRADHVVEWLNGMEIIK